MRRDPLDLRAHLHGRALEYIADVDRRWFAAHPGETHYVRPALEHELCDPRSDECTPALDVPPGWVVLVRVTRLSPIMRTRQPVAVPA